tara:strand:- start:262 stop:438 length:177 start_codon:yes stop_codon:yes gene_type:complete
MLHYWGISSIHANKEIIIACRSLGHSQAIHMKTYKFIYEEIDAIKGAKKFSILSRRKD